MSKKGENIYKRKDGRWEARYSKGVLASGKIKYGYCYGKTYREAKDKVEKIKSSLALGFSTTKQQRKIFSAYCDEWLQLNKNKVKESTYVKYSTAIEKHVKTFLGGYSVQAINSLTVGEFCSHLLCVDKLSSKTVRDILTLLKSILNYTSKQVNLPVIDIVYPKEEKQEIKVLSLEEQKIFTDYLKSDMDNCKFGILLALMTGLRIGEVCSLRWCDISIENMSLSVTSTMQRVKNIDDTNSSKTKIVISKPKSNTSSRVIPLTPYAVEMCKTE